MKLTLHSNIIGEGKPFIILHGFLGMSDNWKTIGKKIAKEGFQVHLIDQRNHGRSPHADAFSYELMVQDLADYCEAHQLDRIHLLGHSMGGKVAMLFVAQYPNKVDKAIIADIGPKYYPPHHHDILTGLNAIDFKEVTSRNEIDTILQPYIADEGVRMFLLKNVYWVTKGVLGLRIHLEALTAKVDEIGKALDEKYRVEKEILFLRGERSSYILPSDLPQLKAQFPNAIVKEVARAGHWLHAENPSDFLDKVLDFVNS